MYVWQLVLPYLLSISSQTTLGPPEMAPESLGVCQDPLYSFQGENISMFWHGGEGRANMYSIWKPREAAGWG